MTTSSNEPNISLGGINIKLFSDAIDALAKLFKGFIGLKDLPANERQSYIDAIDTTFILLDTILLQVIAVLGNLINHAEKPSRFIEDLKAIDQPDFWLRIEKDFGMSSNLRNMRNKMRGLNTLTGRRVTKDWNNLIYMVDNVIDQDEHNIADFISRSLSSLSGQAAQAKASPEGLAQALKEVHQTRESLIKEHRQLGDKHRKILKYI